MTTLLTDPAFHLTMLALAFAAAVEGLVAIWAAVSRVHWFWRALAVWGAVMLLVPIRAYPPAMVFAIASPLTVLLVQAYRRGLGRTEDERRANVPLRLQFRLADLLLAFVIVGLAIAGLLAIQPQLTDLHTPVRISAFPLVAAAISVPTALTFCFVAGPRRRIAALLLALALPVSINVLPGLTGLDQLLSVGGALYLTFLSAEVPIVALAVFLANLVVLIAVPVLLIVAMKHANHGCRRMAAVATITWCILIGLPAAMLYWEMASLAPFPPSVDGRPNHYRQIDAIAKRFNSPLAADEVQGLHETLFPLLEPPNYIPFDPEADATQEYFANVALSEWRELARSLSAESEAAALAGDYDRATRYALANVRLSVALRRGGLLVHDFVGLAIEGSGHHNLISIRDKLSPDAFRTAIEVLRRTAAEPEPLATIMARDRAYSEHAFGWPTRLEYVIERDILGRSELPVYLDAHHRNEAYSALLQTDLAIRLWQHETGRLPSDLTELVPDVLPELPLDPHSGKLLVYRPEGDRFVLYSIGRDGEDNGGRFGNSAAHYNATGYDLDLDTLIRP